MKNQSTKKLFAYIVLIVMVMIFSASAKAQIVYTDIVPDSAKTVTSWVSYTYNLDLNGDSTIDFLIKAARPRSRNLEGPSTCYINITPQGSNAFITTLNTVKKLVPGFTINAGQAWHETTGQYLKSYSQQGFGSPTNTGEWDNVINGYIGLRLINGGQTYYGWVRMAVNVGISAASMTIKDYAYNSIPNQPILAGQTGDNYIFTSASNVSQLCAGTSFNAGYVITGNFDTANIVSVELSDSVGNFSKGIIIGSDMRNISGSIPCMIPNSLSGTGYRFRVISSKPAQIAWDNGTDLMINNILPDTLVTPANTQVVCSGSYVTLTAPLGNGNLYQWKKEGLKLLGSVTRNYNAYTSGLYSCDISNGCGTVHSNVVSLIDPPLPEIHITPKGPLTINSGDSVLLSSSLFDSTYIYRWYRYATLLNPITSSMTYMAKISGNYSLKIIEQTQGCSKISTYVILTVLNPSEVPKTFSVQSSLKVQPNPFSNSVLISLSIQDRQKFTVRIIDLAGRPVKTIASNISGVGNFEYNWMGDDQNGNFLNSGIYFLKLEAEEYSRTEKLILMR